MNNFLYASGSSLKGYSFDDRKYAISRSIIAFFLNPFKKMVSTIVVNTDNLDNFCNKKKVRNIDILKIDTEGTEIDVLLGAKKMLNKTSIVCVEIQSDKKK